MQAVAAAFDRCRTIAAAFLDGLIKRRANAGMGGQSIDCV
jgi:hypothetical protein